MPTTSNFGWTTPADTDLVKDGAAAIRTLGNGIDTSLVDLKGGTTGQVLSKASNTDLDFTWSSVDPLTILDAKGDLISATAADTPARLASSGVNGDVLTVDTTTSTGLKWAAPSGGGASWTLLNSGGTALTGAATITVSGISAQNQLMIIIQDASSASAESSISLRFNADSTTKYNVFGGFRSFSTTYNRDTAEQSTKGQATGQTSIILGRMSSTSTSSLSSFCLVSGTNSTNTKIFHQATGIDISNGSDSFSRNTGGYYTGSSAITSVSVLSDTGNFDAGTIFVYGSAV